MKLNVARAFEKAYSAKNLLAVYHKHLAASKSIGLDRVSAENFFARLVDEVALISKKITTGAYKFTAFKERLISKGVGKAPRVLSIPTIRDRLALRTLCDVLLQAYPDAVGEVAQLKIANLAAALNSGKFTHFVKIDVEQFYPSINHQKLMTQIRKRTRRNNCGAANCSNFKSNRRGKNWRQVCN